MTLAALLEDARARLEQAGVACPSANAEFLASGVLGVSRAALSIESAREFSARERSSFDEKLSRLCGHEPLAYVLRSQPFFGLDLEAGPEALIPRPETEELVDACLELMQGLCSPRMLDIGTGCGCIALALADNLPHGRVVACDKSEAALALARRNLARVGAHARVDFVSADLFALKLEDLDGEPFDLVVSNPPYVPSARIETLEKAVLREPRLALDGGADGLDCVRAVVADATGLLKQGGWLALEIDVEQGEATKSLFAPGFADVEIRKDVQGLDRIVIGKLA